jgi:Mg2+/Co2+ transporter CorB
MTIYDWLTVLAVVICLLISAFFSAGETALTASSRAAMMRLEKQGNKDASIVNRLLATRERMLGAFPPRPSPPACCSRCSATPA